MFTILHFSLIVQDDDNLVPTSVNIRLLSKLLLGTIYFDVGHKNPKIILNENDFLMYRKLPDKTVWSCTQYHKKDRCKAKVMTFGRQATLIGDHNHPPTFKNKPVNHMLSQPVILKKAKQYC